MDGKENKNPEQVAEVVDIKTEQATKEDPRSQESLKKRHAHLVQSRDQAFAQYHALSGAVQVLEQLIQ